METINKRESALQKIREKKLLLNSLSYFGFAVFLFAFYLFLVVLRHGFGTTKALLIISGISMLLESVKLFIEYLKVGKEYRSKNCNEN